MNLSAEIDRKILDFIQYRFMRPDEQPPSVTTHLIRDGIVDSVGILTMVRFVEDEFEITVEPTELIPENFASVEAMRAYVLRVRNSAHTDR